LLSYVVRLEVGGDVDVGVLGGHFGLEEWECCEGVGGPQPSLGGLAVKSALWGEVGSIGATVSGR